MKSQLAHSIKHRVYANDEFMTPPELAKKLVGFVPLEAHHTILEPCPGKGAFFDTLLSTLAVVEMADNFFEWCYQIDWIIGNPPYSKLMLGYGTVLR